MVARGRLDDGGHVEGEGVALGLEFVIRGGVALWLIVVIRGCLWTRYRDRGVYVHALGNFCWGWIRVAGTETYLVVRLGGYAAGERRVLEGCALTTCQDATWADAGVELGVLEG